jgi:hypothetical protein
MDAGDWLAACFSGDLDAAQDDAVKQLARRQKAGL